MARARNIKPGFYLNEQLAGCSIFARYIFPGLWMHADRAGRMEDRPLRLKASLLPYDNADLNELLNELERAELIVRYEVDGSKFIQVVSFEKHQNPHVREPDSTIPAPDKPGAKPVQAPAEHDSGPAESPSLNPESSSPIEPLPEKPAKEKRRATVLADDFKPNETGIAYAERLRVSLDPEIAGFRNWHTAKGSTFKDWQAAWRTWCDKAVEFGRSGDKPNARASPGPAWRAEEKQRMDELTGRSGNGRVERDITGQSERVA